MNNPYNDEFYKNHLQKKKVLEHYAYRIYEMYGPKNVVDVGCGPGHALGAFHAMGCEILGLEYSIEAARKAASENVSKYMKRCDVKDWLTDWHHDKYDVAISWHMAEHVPKKYSHKIVQGLTLLSDIIHFSAAPPGQKGIGHVNCQTPEWWRRKFEQNRYELDEDATSFWYDPMKERYGDNRIGRGIRDNARIYVKNT